MRRKATPSIIASCNVPWKRKISLDILLGIFRGEIEAAAWLGHLDIFFNEVHPSRIAAFSAENDVPLADMGRIFELLPPAFKGRGGRSFFEEGVILNECYC